MMKAPFVFPVMLACLSTGFAVEGFAEAPRIVEAVFAQRRDAVIDDIRKNTPPQHMKNPDIGVVLALVDLQTGTERRLHNPVDAMMNAHAGPAGAEVAGTPKQKEQRHKRREVLGDDAKHGDFFITFTVDDPAKQSAFGMSCGDYIDRWEVGPKASLHLWWKVAGANGTQPLNLALYDASGKQAVLPLEPAPAPEWRELDVPLANFKAAEGFDFNALRSVQIEAAVPKGARVWLDDVYFHQGDIHLGVTDKTITQCMAETSATRPARVEQAIMEKAELQKKQWKGAACPAEAFAAFQKDVLDNPLQVKADLLTFGFFVSYRGCGVDARELELNACNDQTPRIDGKQITYNPPVCHSPWLHGASGTGAVTLTGPVSGKKVVYEFKQLAPKN